MIDKLPFLERLVIKVALAATACGALLNALTFSVPKMPELTFNFGLAIVFVWAAWFHFKYFVKK